MGFAPEADYTPASPNDDATRGGMARLAAAIGAAKASAAADGTPVLLLDAGDFMMGTLFEFLATQASPELALMHALGYDATTIGNHELDWTPARPRRDPAGRGHEQRHLPDPREQHELLRHRPGGRRARGAGRPPASSSRSWSRRSAGSRSGSSACIGANAVQVTPQSAPLTFDPIDVAAARMVKELRETDKVDLVDRPVALRDRSQRPGRGRGAGRQGAGDRRDHQRPHARHARAARPGRQHDHRHRRRVHRLPRRARADRDAVRDAGRAAGRDDRQLHAADHRRHDPRRRDHAGRRRRLHRGARHVARAVGPRLQEGRGVDGRRPAAAFARRRRRSATW